MAELTEAEWDKINATFAADPYKYGLPKRVYGSAVLGSFNIRKLGKADKRTANTWKFLATICKQFDLLALQEVMDNLEGFNKLVDLMGGNFHTVVSDQTGVFPGERGLGERLGFIYNPAIVQRGDIVSDISFDRSKLLKTLVDHHEILIETITPYLQYLDAKKQWEQNQTGPEPKAPKVQLPVFLTFIRQPFCASFQIIGHPDTEPYKIMAINAHLYFGDSTQDRRQEFDALMEWILARVKSGDEAYYPNFILLGDLNLDFDDPVRDRNRIEVHIKGFNDEMGTAANVNFPFLDPHPTQLQPFRTNARLSETFDQIGLFSRDKRLPTYPSSVQMGSQPQGPDYGVFNFVELFREALGIPPLETLPKSEQKAFFAKFEHEVSDHMPIWLRLPLPE
ncbi:MAG: endonuclease/exonuclease/phosphatase [Leptolyngbyaceae cyanobacterium RM1_406_9]|nr:endonuclease/exonuclease/phosphatase [Leptolyngbyaceae cyanobacterium RM1_406_9]